MDAITRVYFDPCNTLQGERQLVIRFRDDCGTRPECTPTEVLIGADADLFLEWFDQIALDIVAVRALKDTHLRRMSTDFTCCGLTINHPGKSIPRYAWTENEEDSTCPVCNASPVTR